MQEMISFQKSLQDRHEENNLLVPLVKWFELWYSVRIVHLGRGRFESLDFRVPDTTQTGKSEVIQTCFIDDSGIGGQSFTLYHSALNRR
jgi:hypothetical protein